MKSIFDILVLAQKQIFTPYKKINPIFLQKAVSAIFAMYFTKLVEKKYIAQSNIVVSDSFSVFR